MSVELSSVTILCRGRVSSAKQQILNKLASNQGKGYSQTQNGSYYSNQKLFDNKFQIISQKTIQSANRPSTCATLFTDDANVWNHGQFMIKKDKRDLNDRNFNQGDKLATTISNGVHIQPNFNASHLKYNNDNDRVKGIQDADQYSGFEFKRMDSREKNLKNSGQIQSEEKKRPEETFLSINDRIQSFQRHLSRNTVTSRLEGSKRIDYDAIKAQESNVSRTSPAFKKETKIESISPLNNKEVLHDDSIENDEELHIMTNVKEFAMAIDREGCKKYSLNWEINTSASKKKSILESLQRSNYGTIKIQDLSGNHTISQLKTETGIDSQSNGNDKELLINDSIGNGEEIHNVKNVKEYAKVFDEETRKRCFFDSQKEISFASELNQQNKSSPEEKFNKSSEFIVKELNTSQPITKQGIEYSTMNIKEANRSIIDRISSMNQHGNKWKERCSTIPDDSSNIRPISVYDIQEKLHTTQTNWKTRVEQKDVKQFTTEAKLLAVQGKDINLQPNLDNDNVFKDNNPSNVCVTRLTKSCNVDLSPRKVTLRSGLDDDETVMCTNNNISAIQSVSKAPLFDNNNKQQVHSHKVMIPRMSDKSLSNFFNRSESDSVGEAVSETINTLDDFNDIFLQREQTLNVHKRSAKPIRKTRTTSRNPLKKLNERLDIVGEYDEVMLNTIGNEAKIQKTDNTKVNIGFAKEALAGLSSKVDFSRVKLKCTGNGNGMAQFTSPYKDVMLISVKGRKKVQLRLVKPAASSINCGDCYLLVTPARVFVWQGLCSNIIEVNKANELGLWIAKCKDLSYKGFADKPTIVKSNDDATKTNVLQFWSCLKCDKVQQCSNPGMPDEDDIYEQRIQTTNMVFQVCDKQLCPLEEYWGRSLKYKMLADNQVYIFDFGSELYLWTGSKADSATKSHGKHFLRQLFEKGFDYEQCSINPLDPLPESQEKAQPTKELSRPDWVIAGRISQKGETILFKEKFSDWPETSRLIKVNNNTFKNYEKKPPSSDLDAADLAEVLGTVHPSVNLTIDGKNVGRGGNWKVMEDGILREFDVSTINLEAWHINDNEAQKIEEKCMGQFFSGDAYIIRWDFELKTLGRFQKSQAQGNVTSAFFFWQGYHTSVTEKTACALHTINLDKDKVAQIRVKQHDESPAFCRLFDGYMVVYQGKRRHTESERSLPHLFILRGEVKGEAHFVEVNCQPESLRDRGVFLLINNSNGNAYLWFGRLASEQAKECAQYCIESLNRKKPCELGIGSDVKMEIQEEIQDKEHRSFWHDMKAVRRWKSSNLSVSLQPIRGWLVSSVTNSFELLQLRYSLNSDDGSIPSFPLTQSMLYKVSQPALFVIVVLPHLYLWQGWWPHLAKSIASDSDSDVENNDTTHDWAIPKNRIAAEKIATLKSLNSYIVKHKSEGVTSSIVYAGLEPPAFQELFPSWEINETAKSANLKKNYILYQEDSIAETLDRYLTETFTISRLQKRPLPESVVLSKIECYLHDKEFQELFKMTKEEFYNLSPWKQIEKKKEANLF